ncbi:formylglycine-generating enzyme family protein [Bythopirellula polymerisocia]|uniref:Serine/threonine-protein kinase pkn1 n=1 Tax=Bythopirellula polymerisocia TaxID=2528003 RepID=A0A5C6D4F7_9BACT|nr:formylglycine-generating enzyme family protein [Bythopirellula polymerisocia]TWU30136.1 Serine/threonine-protein kinase pkn1 [Bythopirellula polymerisocia]
MARQHKKMLWLLAALLPLPLAYTFHTVEREPTSRSNAAAKNGVRKQSESGMALLPEGVFLMGSPRPGPADQRPVHRVGLKSFRLDITLVTNREFENFIDETGYLTTAEKRGWSLLFDRKSGRWDEAAGVCWRHPTGANSSLVGKDDYPVVHVSWFDAMAYATWAGKRLSSEAEYEYAARGGLSDAPFPWGRELTPENQMQANYWQGKFPLTNLGQDGFLGVAPVKSFPANRFGLFDIAGNVACWCADWYGADSYGSGGARSGSGPDTGTERVLRGGSWISQSEKGGGLQVSDRDHAPPTATNDYVGFRCARDGKPLVK